ncbi:methyltransferase domain-containing protein [Flammeovirga yaeyamensis]|uniref:Methyltransferase domain-containing protein n=1 Tax=Flammeovirga yaeyamensis TaxID=367791 RepID=A0AAX1N4T5_9BACT|nr:class I SAM-dependent methyltransferase [Flammeovirga yaeyamensis]MBB3700203.1 SAM-dependent methyltransferase [Flammeovirga yaeyamensis]NMF37167.1 methyltransferase domain-containing protein [Flammeovirga yaeyamensis]QWG00858.1 methyltransferase domain-containing protein [Flammeovirga yaeyamensis]
MTEKVFGKALAPENDPMGSGIASYYDSKDDELCVKVYSDFSEPDDIPVPLLFREENDMPEIEVLALDQCNGKILDVGAGAGSHAMALQKRGKDVTAMDISLKAVETMKKRGVKKVIAGDIYQYTGPKFDTLLMLMNGIGLVGTLDGLAEFLVKAKDYLNPGGQLVFDSSDIIHLFEDEDGSYLIDLTAEYYGQIQYWMEFKDIKGAEFDWLYVSYPVLEEYAATAGYDIKLLYVGELNHYLVSLSLKND